MLDWLTLQFSPNAELTVYSAIIRLLAAGFFGTIVSLIYFASFGRKKADALPFGVTLILLAVLVAMTSQIIGNNQALAFSLVGTLAIVRFRTTMDDTRDTAFVIFAVTVGMGSAVGALMVVLVGIPVVGMIVFLSTMIAYRMTLPSVERNVIIRLPMNSNDPSIFLPTLQKVTQRCQIMGVESAKNGEAIEYVYLVRFLTPDWLSSITQLKAIPGVTNVEVKGK